MSPDVWIGTIVSIPVSIGVALAVPHIQGWISRRGQISHERQQDKIKSEYLTVLYYALHTDMLIGRMVTSALSMLVMIMWFILMLVSGILAGRTLGTLLPLPTTISSHRGTFLIFALSALFAMSGALAVIFAKYAQQSITLFLNVKNIESYAQSVPESIRDVTLEKIVLGAKQDRALPGYGALKHVGNPDKPSPSDHGPA